MNTCAIGLDFGTNSARAVLIDVASGEEAASAVYDYTHGSDGVVTDDGDAYLARQHPADYVAALEHLIPALLSEAERLKGFTRENIIGIGVDTTASTPVPVDRNGTPLGLLKEFEGNPNAMAWLWKDHTASAEAGEFMNAVAEQKLPYLGAYGGVYSSEWYWSKALRCARVDARVAAAAYTWVEQSDLIPALLTGAGSAAGIRRNSCAAGYKDMYNPGAGGYPPAGFLESFHPHLGAVRATLPERVYAPGERIGVLAPRFRKAWGLRGDVAVSAGIIDAHAGAIGSGIRPGALVKIIGTSTCDMALLPPESGITAIPGISGVVKDGILPGFYGIEAGQAAVGDILNWHVRGLLPTDGGRTEEELHALMTKRAGAGRAGLSGLLALDWHNGNRNVLMDPLLSGLIVGYTLQTKPEEVYRALIEATGFGARAIIDRLRSHSVPVEEIICCGGIAEKNEFFMQVYADILGAPIRVARSAQAPALGAAVCGAVAAGRAAGGYDSFAEAIGRMTGVREKGYRPRRDEAAVYDELYGLYMRLHDSFGSPSEGANLFNVMKRLIAIRNEAAKR